MPDRTLKKSCTKTNLVGIFQIWFAWKIKLYKKPENCKVDYREEINIFVLNLEQNELNVKKIN